MVNRTSRFPSVRRDKQGGRDIAHIVHVAIDTRPDGPYTAGADGELHATVGITAATTARSTPFRPPN